MLTVKYRDDRGSELIQPNVETTSFHEGVLTARLSDGGSVTYGPAMANDNFFVAPIAYVMNDNGATVARYEFYPMPEKMQADPEFLEAARSLSQAA
jgi:hypothetical protein